MPKQKSAKEYFVT